MQIGIEFSMVTFISGIHLDEQKREMVASLQEKILSLSQHFMTNCHKPRKVQKDTLPEELSKLWVLLLLYFYDACILFWLSFEAFHIQLICSYLYPWKSFGSFELWDLFLNYTAAQEDFFFTCVQVINFLPMKTSYIHLVSRTLLWSKEA